MSKLSQKYETARAAADKFGAGDISDQAIAARRTAAQAFAAAFPGEAYPGDGATSDNDAQRIAAMASEMAEGLVAERLPAALAAHLAANPPHTATRVPSLAETTLLGLPLGDVVDLVGMIAGAVVPGAQVAGFTIAQLTGLAAGVANAIPEALGAFEEIKALAESGAEPTPEQLARWNAAADAANATAKAAEDEVLLGGGG